MANGTNRELKSIGYELFILLLSILSVVNMLFYVLGTLIFEERGPSSDVILIMDAVITPFFVFDFLYRLLTASSKRAYFFRGQGWADLLAVIPLFRIFRVFRVLRVVRLIGARGVERLGIDLLEARASATFLLTIFMVLLVLEVSGASIYYVEGADPAANIQSASDALWWGIVTITTVGYGDQYPVTDGGRIIGVFLLISGIGLFSVLTGFIANIFLAPRRHPRFAEAPTDPRAIIAGMRQLLAEQDERADMVRTRLDELQRTLTANER
ncbi:MAG TPA: potassium channel family protein [Candidatus Limnocylindria bacterium]|nr:potassium channel family protein [Candidatus Limnocylindria bacterium]